MKFIITIIIALLLSNIVTAGEKCSYDHREIKVSKDYAFKNLLAVSADLSKELCLIKVKDKSSTVALKKVADIWKKTALTEAAALKGVGLDLDQEIELLAKGFNQETPFDWKKIGAVVLNKIPYKNWKLTITPPGDINITRSRIGDDIDPRCKNNDIGYNKSCYEVLEDFKLAVASGNADSNRVDLEESLTNIGIYSKSWDNYFNEARSLAPWELGFNTWLYEDELKGNDFVLPPNYQFFFLHPSIVIENVSKAIDGNQQKEAISLEWIGVNRWNASVPLGISIVSTYADRASVNDIRHGIMIHIANDYSIGFTDIGGDEEGIFITVDLLKMIQGKEKRFNNYKAMIEKKRLSN